MTPTISRAQARLLDQRAVDEYGMSGLVLMENAGRGVADQLCAAGVGGPVAICCGQGNNGGDGLVIARHLDLRGHRVCILLLADPARLSPDAAANYRIAERAGLAIRQCRPEDLDRELATADWVVDALLGTGARGEPRSPLAEAIEQINASRARVLAVDVPSGLDCDTGTAAARTVRAHVTCTFVATKPGFLVPGAAEFTGTVRVVDIGAPAKLVNEILSGSAAAKDA